MREEDILPVIIGFVIAIGIIVIIVLIRNKKAKNLCNQLRKGEKAYSELDWDTLCKLIKWIEDTNLSKRYPDIIKAAKAEYRDRKPRNLCEQLRRGEKTYSKLDEHTLSELIKWTKTSNRSALYPDIINGCEAELQEAEFRNKKAENLCYQLRRGEKTYSELDEHTLSELIKWIKNTNQSMLYPDIINKPSLSYEDCVGGLLYLYDKSRGGFGYGSDAAKPVMYYGKRLNELGGFKFMLKAHKEFSERCPHLGVARNLEQIWDGIGSWRG